MTARRKLLIVFGASALAAPLAAFAQRQPSKIPRIGYLSGRGGPPDPSIIAFVQGLRDLGYVEGKNIQFEYRYVQGDLARVPGLVAEFVQLKVDVFVSPNQPAIRAAKRAATTMPIVMVVNVDPVAAGIVESLARPGGNITGVSRLTRELSGKRLELLKELVPRISRVGVLWDAVDVSSGTGDYERAARALKIQLVSLEVRGPQPDLEGAFRAAAKGRVNALITQRSGLLVGYSRQIADLAIKNRLPSMFEGGEFIEAGGLISYSPNDREGFRRAAVFVDKILKGAKPGDLPIEQATEFELVINTKTAKALGLSISKDFLLRAHKVIE